MSAAMTTTDRIKALGIAPDVLTHVLQMFNSVRLAEHGAQLGKASAHATGFVAGLQLGRAITDHQTEQLVELFDEVAARRSEQLASAIDETNAGT
jgi:hypothetical protein